MRAATPATVRVNFNSDPDGAVVLRRDGKTLGLTPLSIEIAVQRLGGRVPVQEAGLRAKTMYVVPNLPSPLFATLRRISKAAPEAAPVRRHARADGGRAARHRNRRRRRRRRRRPEPAHAQASTTTAVLEPTFNERSSGPSCVTALRGARAARAEVEDRGSGPTSRRPEADGRRPEPWAAVPRASGRSRADAVAAGGLRLVEALVGALDQRRGLVELGVDRSRRPSRSSPGCACSRT